MEEVQHIELPLEQNDFTTFRRKSFTPPQARSENPEQDYAITEEQEPLKYDKKLTIKQ